MVYFPVSGVSSVTGRWAPEGKGFQVVGGESGGYFKRAGAVMPHTGVLAPVLVRGAEVNGRMEFLNQPFFSLLTYSSS